MIAKGKKILAFLLVCVMLVTSSVSVFAEDTGMQLEDQWYILTVNVTGDGNVELSGDGVEPGKNGSYAVLSGSTVNLNVVPGESSQLKSMELDGSAVSESFVMLEKDVVLDAVFETAPEATEILAEEIEKVTSEDQVIQEDEIEEDVDSDANVENDNEMPEKELLGEDEYITNSKGITVLRSLLCDDPNCLEQHVGVTLDPISEDSISGKSAKTLNVARLVQDPYIGMTLNGKNASVLFLGVPGTNGDFSVTINDGALAGTKGTGTCVNHGAANPGESGATICTWEATCTAISGSVATWSFVMTPPGACTPGSILGYQRVGMVASVPFGESKGSIELKKSSANPELTANNSCYSLAGAVYGVYSGKEKIAELTTDSKGYAKADNIPAGNYTAKEITAPKGYALDLTAHNVTVVSGQTATVTVTDLPQSDPVWIFLGKVDEETTENMPQGSASLKNAEFTVKYYDGFYDTDPAEQGVNPVRMWVMRTDEDGFSALDNAYKVSGDDFYYMSNGDVTLPLGTITIQETQAPEGYLLNEEIFIRQITTEGTAESVNTYNVPTIPEDIIRGDLQIIKYGESNAESDDSGADIKPPLEFVKFHLQSKTTGEIFTIVTDENGIASTVQLGISDRGNLVRDTYIVTEESPYPEYDEVAPFEVTISEEGQTLYYILRNDTVDAPIRVQKVDETTGKVISVAGAQFQVLDSEKNPIKMTVSHYPSLVETDTFETDDNGMFVLPEKLEYGMYYLHEVEAPEGYVLGDEDIPFTVDEEYQWEEPLIVQYADAPAMGRIELVKTDSETGDTLEGAEFVVTAAEDIVTGDGTVRATAGEIVDTVVTDSFGRIITNKLFLGKYTITETKQPLGYVLPDKSWDVELVYQDQHTAVVVEDLEVKNEPTTIIVDKKVTGSEERLEGVKFVVWNKDKEDPVDPEMTYKDVYETDQDGRIQLKYLEPGTYCVKEVESVPGYAYDDTEYEFTVDGSGRINGEGTYILTVENEKTEIVETNVVNVETGNQQAYPGQIKAVDTVSLINLMPGTEYQLKGVIVDSVTGLPIREGNSLTGQEVTVEKLFTASDPAMDVEVEFAFDASALAGRTVTVFEYLYQDGIEIGAHADKDDTKQQLVIKNPTIYTTVIDVKSGTQNAEPGKNVHIRDKVYYSDLIPGVYQMRGVVMSVSTGLPLVVDGEEVVTEKEVTINEAEGVFDMDFRFDASELAGQQVVIYEYLYQNGELIVSHEDINAKNQTIWFKELIQERDNPDMPVVQTGDDGVIIYQIVGLALMVVSAGLLIFAVVLPHRKKRKHKKEDEK